MLTTCALVLTSLFPVPAPALEDVRARYVALEQAHDEHGCQELLRANRAAILPVIDADLEGSLKVRERKKGPALSDAEQAQIAAMHARALWGSRQAEALGLALVADYAASFTGWDEAQRKSFRAGQAAYRGARDALEKGDPKAALEAARRCRDLATPLGDWWGAQMGWEAEARAHEALGANEDALAAWSRARILARALSLVGDEYEATASVARLASELGRAERAKAAARAALALARELGDAEGARRLEPLAK